MKEIYVITGAKGSGKSVSVFTFPPPNKDEMKKLLVVDTEDSANKILESLGRMGMEPGCYIRMYDRLRVNDNILADIAQGKLPWVTSRERNNLASYYEYFINEINDKLKPGQYTYMGIDTIEPLEAGMQAWVEANRRESGWSGNRSYGRLETEGVRPLYEGILEACHQRGVQYFILTSHLKRLWENDKPVLNKLIPGGRLALLTRISTTMLWLTITGGNGMAPSAITLKCRSTMMSVENGKWVVKRPLPPKIPVFSWAAIREYESKGCDWNNLRPEEQLNSEDKEMISELLNDAQIRQMILSDERELAEIKAMTSDMFVEQPQQDDIEQSIVSLLNDGMSPLEITKALDNVTLPMVIKVRKEMKEHHE